MENADSLGTDPLGLPGQYLYDVRPDPTAAASDSLPMAVLALTSLERPVRRLFVTDPEGDAPTIVAEGTIRAPVAWSPDGRRLAFARLTRGEHGSLLNDLFIVDRDGRHERRLTRSRRAASPAFAPDGRQLVFVGSERGTANLFLLDLETLEETPLTDFTGDVQIASVEWHPTKEAVVFARFADDGRRDLVRLDLKTGRQKTLTDGDHDDRDPIWSPDGERIAYTSLRDNVPNVFVLDLGTGLHRRVTNLVTGATAHAWLPPDSAYAEGSLVVISGASKTRDHAFRIDAARVAEGGGAGRPGGLHRLDAPPPADGSRLDDPAEHRANSAAIRLPLAQEPDARGHHRAAVLQRYGRLGPRRRDVVDRAIGQAPDFRGRGVLGPLAGEKCVRGHVREQPVVSDARAEPLPPPPARRGSTATTCSWSAFSAARSGGCGRWTGARARLSGPASALASATRTSSRSTETTSGRRRTPSCRRATGSRRTSASRSPGRSSGPTVTTSSTRSMASARARR